MKLFASISLSVLPYISLSLSLSLSLPSLYPRFRSCMIYVEIGWNLLTIWYIKSVAVEVATSPPNAIPVPIRIETKKLNNPVKRLDLEVQNREGWTLPLASHRLGIGIFYLLRFKTAFSGSLVATSLVGIPCSLVNQWPSKHCALGDCSVCQQEK